MLPGLLLLFALDGMIQLHFQALMVADKMVVTAPPLEMLHQLRSVLRRSPGAAGELGDRLPDGEVYPLDKGRVDSSAQSRGLKPVTVILCSPQTIRRSTSIADQGMDVLISNAVVFSRQ